MAMPSPSRKAWAGRRLAIPHLHFKRTTYKAGGRKATSRIAYITRKTDKAFSAAEKQLAYIVRADREDLIHEATRNLPAWANGNPHTYFQAAERYERANGIAFEEWKITLPFELTQAQNQTLVDDLVWAIAGDALPVTYAFHQPQTLDGRQEQPHIHMLLSARQNDGMPRDARQHFRRYNAAHPERGGAQKSNAFRHKGAVRAHRELIADVINLHLEAHGQVGRVTPQSLQARGIDRKPEPKLLPSESAAYRTQGKASATMQTVLATRAQRNRIKEANQARTWWEDRKVVLGLFRSQPLAEQLAMVVAARQARIQGPPMPATRREQQAITQAIACQHAQTGQALQGTRQVPRVRRRSVSEVAQALHARAQRLGQGAEEHGHGKLHVRLHEEDREQDHGLGF